MSDKQKVFVILSPGFAASEEDTTCLPERQVFLRALKDQFPMVRIIVLSFQYPHFKKKYWWHGIEVISFNGRNKGKLSRVVLWMHAWRSLLQVKKQHSIIGVLGFWMGDCSFIGKWFARRYKLPFFSWILGQDAKKGNKYVRLIKPQPTELIALSDFLREEFYRNYKILPAYTIPSGINEELFPKTDSRRDIDILGVGSLILLKNYSAFLEAVVFLKKYFPELRATICGKGPQEEYLLQLIEQFGLQSHVTLAGELPHSEILQLMQRSKILLHPSSYEGLSTVCLEALYAGAHVVSFCRAMNESIRHWHIVHSKEEMLQKLFELLNSDMDNSSVMPYPISRTVEETIKLFDIDLLLQFRLRTYIHDK